MLTTDDSNPFIFEIGHYLNKDRHIGPEVNYAGLLKLHVIISTFIIIIVITFIYYINIILGIDI